MKSLAASLSRHGHWTGRGDDILNYGFLIKKAQGAFFTTQCRPKTEEVIWINQGTKSAVEDRLHDSIPLLLNGLNEARRHK